VQLNGSPDRTDGCANGYPVALLLKTPLIALLAFEFSYLRSRQIGSGAIVRQRIVFDGIA
jgi:hypothetical protein